MAGVEEGREVILNSTDSDLGDFVRVAREAEYSLSVGSTKTVHSLDGEHTAYCIVFQTRSAAFHLQKTRVWRRFSEFLWLRKELSRIDTWRQPPPLPPRRLWNNQDPELVQQRQDQLEKWLYTVLSEPSYLSCSALHLFLQTELTTEDILAYLHGHLSEERVSEVWANHGSRFHYQPHNPLHNPDCSPDLLQTPREILFCAEEDVARELPSPSSNSDPPGDFSPEPESEGGSVESELSRRRIKEGAEGYKKGDENDDDKEEEEEGKKSENVA